MAEYRSRTFTFHLTPEFVPPNPALSRVFDRQLVFSPESLQFLRNHNFEFGKTFAQGIPYLSRTEERMARNFYAPRVGNPSQISRRCGCGRGSCSVWEKGGEACAKGDERRLNDEGYRQQRSKHQVWTEYIVLQTGRLTLCCS
jgi:hypothetical protein